MLPKLPNVPSSVGETVGYKVGLTAKSKLVFAGAVVAAVVVIGLVVWAL